MLVKLIVLALSQRILCRLGIFLETQRIHYLGFLPSRVRSVLLGCSGLYLLYALFEDFAFLVNLIVYFLVAMLIIRISRESLSIFGISFRSAGFMLMIVSALTMLIL
jgi:hypothetical protein